MPQFRIAPIALVLVGLFAAGCQAPPTGTPNASGGAVVRPAANTANTANAQPTPTANESAFHVSDIIKPGDRVLFVGDDITQHMFYTRAVASALMAIMPEAQLHFFNGGKDGATAHNANEWVDDLIVLTRPTVVFVALGFNDGWGKEPTEELIANFRKDLGEVIDRVRGYDYIRQVFVLSPPPIQSAVAGTETMYGQNVRLLALAKATRELTEKHKVNFIGLFDYILRVYVAANEAGGSPLTIGDRWPDEPVHALIASAILWGIGVRSEELDRVGWSPLKPGDMRRIRQAMVLRTRPVNLEQAMASRALYEQMRRFDEVFFQAWRLSGLPGSTRSQPELITKSEQVWADIQAMASRIYSTHPTPQTQPTPQAQQTQK